MTVVGLRTGVLSVLATIWLATEACWLALSNCAVGTMDVFLLLYAANSREESAIREKLRCRRLDDGETRLWFLPGVLLKRNRRERERRPMKLAFEVGTMCYNARDEDGVVCV